MVDCICIIKTANSAPDSTFEVLNSGDACTASGKALKKCGEAVTDVECAC